MTTVAYPTVPVGHPDYKWTTGADVQATWRRFGWTPPSEGKAPPPAEKVNLYEPPRNYWRNK